MSLDKTKLLIEAIDSNDEDRFEILVSDLNTIYGEINLIERELKDKTSELEASKKDLDKLLEKQFSQKDDNSEEIAQLAQKIEDLKSQQETINLKNIQLQGKVSELEIDLDSKNTQLSKLEGYKRKIKLLEQSLAEEREKLEREFLKPDYSDEVQRLRKEVGNLQDKIRNNLGKDDSEVLKGYKAEAEKMRRDNERLTNSVKEKTEKILALTTEIELLKKTPKFSIEDKKELEDRVVSLQTQLSAKSKETNKVPIITEMTKYTGSKIIVFRELKPCIYMNSLIEFVAENYAIYNKTEGKIKGKKLLLVLDPLDNDNRVMKYGKHRFNINSAVNSGDGTDIKDFPVLITDLPEEEIGGLVDFSDFKHLTIIDRYGKEDCAVRRLDTDIYYSVDSKSDPIDFNLNRHKCVAYLPDPDNSKNQSMYKFNIEGPRNFGYYIEPVLQWSEELEDELRHIMFASTDFAKEVLCYED